MKITLGQRIFVSHEVDQLFEKIKARLQGRFFKGPAIYFQAIIETEPEDTVEGAYNYVLNTLYGAGKKPDNQTLENLSEVLGNYLEAQKLKVKNHILADMISAKTKKDAIKAIENHVDKSTKYIDMLVSTEAHTIKAYANREGISMIAADMNIEDPIIVFTGRVDNKLCRWCKEMYHDPSNLEKPRPWRLSQLVDGYFKPKEWDGKTVYAAAHPRCRHSMSMITKHFGFDENGMTTFVNFNYDYYNDYHGIKKTEDESVKKTEPQSVSNITDFFMDYDEFLKNSDQLHDHNHDEET